MEELEFWVDMAKSVGMSLDIFQDLKDRSLIALNLFQENIKQIQDSFASPEFSSSDLMSIENSLSNLSKVLFIQESMVLVKALELFFHSFIDLIDSAQTKPKIKKLLRTCKKIQKRISNFNSPPLEHLLLASLDQVSFYKQQLKSKLTFLC